jgi:predicted ribosomally synthesized peptide with nif11-like leader
VSIKEITNFSEKSKTDTELGAKLKECQKIKELIALGSEYGFTLDEVDLYPPNEPQFVAEQLSEKLEKALLRM